MKKIGFIDYFLDEFHANKYVETFKELSGGEFEVAYAYGMIDVDGKMTNKEWAEKHNVELLPTIAEVVEKSDCLVVLSPDNPEMHEELCELPMKSGKLTYVDKTFSPDKATAIRIFDLAKKYGTKCFSTSALRYATEWKEIDKSKIERLYSEGSGFFENYAIHQIEPIVMLMDTPAKRVMALGDDKHPSLVIEFEDGRIAQMMHRFSQKCSFQISYIDEEHDCYEYQVKSSYFDLFVKEVVEFFKTGEVPVTHEQTIDVMGILEAGKKALENPFEWFNI